MEIRKLAYYMQRHDERGLFRGLVNSGDWREINLVQSSAGTVRGNHYHKETHEVIFLLYGEAEVTFQNIHDPHEQIVFHLSAGEGIEVTPYILHTLRYLTDSEHIALLSHPFDPADPDLHTL
jgi:dTDP-4-dehydrorhamnose 3,5-epimerase-like enzyme